MNLTDALQTLRYLSPPDTLLSQISLYLEEKQEDQDELHDKSLGRRQASGGVSGPFDAVLSSLRDRPELEPIILDLLQHVVALFDRPLEPCAAQPLVALTLHSAFRGQLVSIVTAFLEHLHGLTDLDGTWRSFMRMFLASIQHLVGDYAIVRSADVSDAASVPTSFVRELEALRTQVDTLSDEVRPVPSSSPLLVGCTSVHRELWKESVTDARSESVAVRYARPTDR